MRTSDFDFPLPDALIAQHPVTPRDQSRLLVLTRADGKITHERFSQLREHLRSGDVLVLNDSRVISARLRGVSAESGARFELLLLLENSTNDWWAMMRPGKRARLHTKIKIQDRAGEMTDLSATVLAVNEDGHRRLSFSGTSNIRMDLPRIGEIPLPPYIRRNKEDYREDAERYQTVYAQSDGSVAAPTAGLHFTSSLLEQITASGVRICHVTLHVGLGTFSPVKADQIEKHVMHEEYYEVPLETARVITQAKQSGQRVVAVGTTSVRVLESAGASGAIQPGAGRTKIFIHPPYSFRWIDAIITNFHLPRSTLLMLVSAFAAPGDIRGREIILHAYEEAVRERYRFFSYGDAMLLL